MSAIASLPPDLSTRAASRSAFARSPAPEMLWIASELTTTSNEPSSKGSWRMSAVCSSTRSATPSRSALQAPGRHQQHRAAAAADVEQPLVPPEIEPVEQLGPDGELARAGGVDEE